MKLDEIQTSDEELRVMLEAGFIFREASRYDDAEIVFRGAMELLPDSEVPRVALGTVELHRGRFAEAEVAIRETVKSYPESLYAQVHHAEALLFLQRRAEAEAELNEILETDPNSPHSRMARALLDAADMICGPANSGSK